MSDTKKIHDLANQFIQAAGGRLGEPTQIEGEIGIGGTPAEAVDLTAFTHQQRAHDLAAEQALAEAARETTDAPADLTELEQAQLRIAVLTAERDQANAARAELVFKLERQDQCIEDQRKNAAKADYSEIYALRQQVQQLQAQLNLKPPKPAVPQREYKIMEFVGDKELAAYLNAGWQKFDSGFVPVTQNGALGGMETKIAYTVVFVRDVPVQPTVHRNFTTQAAPGRGAPLMEIPAAPPPPVPADSPLLAERGGAGVGIF